MPLTGRSITPLGCTWGETTSGPSGLTPYEKEKIYNHQPSMTNHTKTLQQCFRNFISVGKLGCCDIVPLPEALEEPKMMQPVAKTQPIQTLERS